MAAKTGLLFTLRLIPMVSAMLARRGVDAAPMLEQTGVPLDAMRGEITAPLARVQAFMARAADVLGTDMFGIELAQQCRAARTASPNSWSAARRPRRACACCASSRR